MQLIDTTKFQEYEDDGGRIYIVIKENVVDDSELRETTIRMIESGGLVVFESKSNLCIWIEKRATLELTIEDITDHSVFFCFTRKFKMVGDDLFNAAPEIKSEDPKFQWFKQFC
jgi:hypothetical protein